MFPFGVIACPLHLVAPAIFAQLVHRLSRHAQSVVDFRCPPASLVPFLLPFGLVSLEAFAFPTQRRRLRLLCFVLACQFGLPRVDGGLLPLYSRSPRLQIAIFLRQPCRNGRRAGKPLVERRFLGALFRKFFLLALGRLPYLRNSGSGLPLF